VTSNQLVTSVLVVLLTAMVCVALTFQRGAPRRWTFPLLFLCAVLSVCSWTDYGRFQTIAVDASPGISKGAGRKKVLQHRPLHFHEFVHYYVGAKYFREVGYLGLYDCVTLADREISEEDGVRRITGYVRNLDDVLRDKPYDAALAGCREGQRKNFSDERWGAFKQDLRELHRLVDDGHWGSVVYDAGFNPPPSLILVSSPIANLIPIRSGNVQTFLFATGIDLWLLIVCAFAVALAFGRTTLAVWAVYFGATFLSHYTWNGGSLLRFSWLTFVVLGLAAVKRERWALAGALFAAATCDRIFPVAFGAFALVPIAAKALRSPEHRRALKRFGLAFGVTLSAVVVASTLVFGLSSWRVFFTRVIHHSDVYYVMHVGLKKVLTFRSWVPSQNFHGHVGLENFQAWNLRLHETWASMRAVTIPVRGLALLGTIWASLRRKPHEAGILGGVMFMFFFNLPANYYYCVLTLIPALVFRGAATATNDERRWRDLAVFAGFTLFWVYTFVSPQISPDVIIVNHSICTVLLAFLTLWIAAWCEPRALVDLRGRLASLLARPS
jgi:hypothetical protein